MLSKEQMLKIDPTLKRLSDEELLELRDSLYNFAQMAFEAFYARKSGSKLSRLGVPRKRKAR